MHILQWTIKVFTQAKRGVQGATNDRLCKTWNENKGNPYQQKFNTG